MPNLELELRRDKKTAFDTTGELVELGPRGFLCYILEDAVRELAFSPDGGVAIPEGRYRVDSLPSQRFQKVLPRVLNVPGRSGILIHPGNSRVDTTGCLLPGTSRHTIADATQFVMDSRRAFGLVSLRINEALRAGREVWLTVRS